MTHKHTTQPVPDEPEQTHGNEQEIELHRKPLDITLLIQELLPSFQPGWDARRQTFTLHLPEKAPRVLGDADRVTQVLSNLLSNAHKYTPDEGHIALSVEIAEPVARVEVTDSGIGLSKEEQALLFTPFYRAHNAATEAIGGTGPGLVITRSLVEMQGGEMQVSSDNGIYYFALYPMLLLSCNPLSIRA